MPAHGFRSVSGEPYALPLPLEVVGYVPPLVRKLPPEGVTVSFYAVERRPTGDKFFLVHPGGVVVPTPHVRDRFDIMSQGHRMQPIQEKLEKPACGHIDKGGKLSLRALRPEA